jgi:hypothetical protein
VYGEQETDSSFETDDGVGDDDWIFVMVLSLLFAFCIALFGSVLGYISVLDDSILKRYRNEGFAVEADIRSAEFLRGGTGSDAVCFQANQKEYVVTVEYNQLISETYRIRVRKQIRVMQSDFIHPELNGAHESALDERNKEANPKEDDIAGVDPESLITKRPQIIFNQESFFQQFFLEHRKLELLVLGDHPKSGFPARQLDRRLGLRYRLSSVAFVISTILLALFCFGVAVQSIMEEEDANHRQSGWIIVWVFVTLTAAQIPCIHLLLNKILVDSLEEEYCERAELAPAGQEDSSLSSAGSDLFLSPSGLYRSLSSLL